MRGNEISNYQQARSSEFKSMSVQYSFMAHPYQRAIFELRAIFHKSQIIINSNKMTINKWLINKLIYWLIKLRINIKLTLTILTKIIFKNRTQTEIARW